MRESNRGLSDAWIAGTNEKGHANGGAGGDRDVVRTVLRQQRRRRATATSLAEVPPLKNLRCSPCIALTAKMVHFPVILNTAIYV